MKFCYVILHYKNSKDTIKCVESILTTASPDSEIIIVDNGSGDHSGERMQERYSTISRIHILILEQNLGFSRGNNTGYQYARETFAPDYIIVTNNDVVFTQNDFEDRVNQIYRETRFDVLGPDIYVPRHGDHQSPLFQTAITIPALEKEIAEYQYYKAHPRRFNNRLRIHAFKNMLCSKSRIINAVYAHLRGKEVLDYRQRYIDVGLQGACIIYSRRFIDQEGKAFDPEPFLYEEEVFLFCRCQSKGYKMVYDPSITIRHEEAASFSNMSKDRQKRLEFMLEHHVKARQELLEYLKGNL